MRHQEPRPPTPHQLEWRLFYVLLALNQIDDACAVVVTYGGIQPRHAFAIGKKNRLLCCLAVATIAKLQYVRWLLECNRSWLQKRTLDFLLLNSFLGYIFFLGCMFYLLGFLPIKTDCSASSAQVVGLLGIIPRKTDCSAACTFRVLA